VHDLVEAREDTGWSWWGRMRWASWTGWFSWWRMRCLRGFRLSDGMSFAGMGMGVVVDVKEMLRLGVAEMAGFNYWAL